MYTEAKQNETVYLWKISGRNCVNLWSTCNCVIFEQVCTMCICKISGMKFNVFWVYTHWNCTNTENTENSSYVYVSFIFGYYHLFIKFHLVSLLLAAGGEPCVEPAISLHSHHVSLVQWTTRLLPITRDPGSNPWGLIMWNWDSPVSIVLLQEYKIVVDLS